MFNLIIDKVIEFGNVKIVMENKTLTFSIDNMFYLKDDFNYINYYCRQLPMLNFKNILVGGLGLGIIPFYIEKYRTSEIDVVENNKNVINAIKELNHLKKTSIIEENFLSYTPEKKYDLILADLWWLQPTDFIEQKNTIIQNYKPYLNEGGKIYFPITNELI
jgi:spermidine synthase